ncbi:MAG: ferredoxin III, nif-specific [Rhodospirillales bacterium]|nr:MAG: ferredoxin III, nif-specific [Rhodospirillales bacterium]
MTTAQYLTRDGTAWQPAYVDSVDPEACIGCGRCFKVCGQGVFRMMGVDEDGGFVDPDDDDVERMVMTVADEGRGKCIGCGACTRVCGKSAQVMATAA